MNRTSRRQFLASATLLGLGVILASCAPKKGAESPAVPASPRVEPVFTATPAPAPTLAPTGASATPQPTASPAPAQPSSAGDVYLAVARGADPEEITRRAIAALGGMERFVKKGYDVIIKPNICNANHGPEYASTTNPTVVATLVRLALAAGAKSVRVMDYPFSGSAQEAYARSGIEEAVKAAGGKMELMASALFEERDIPNGLDIKKWRFYRPILEADLVINVPIAKHHSLARLTLAGKNLMGVIENRPGIHRNLGQRIADLASLVRPQLTVVDAVRILVDNGPTGGNLADVKQMNTVIASHDWVAADAYATSLFGLKPEDISYIVAGDAMGLGTKDLSRLRIEEIAL